MLYNRQTLIKQFHAEINHRIQLLKYLHHRFKTRIGQAVFQLGNLHFVHVHQFPKLRLGQIALQAGFFNGLAE